MSLPVVRSCTNCPSLLSPKDGAKMFGASTGSSMCARFGKVLDRPFKSDEGNEKTRIAIAEACSSYGEPQGVGITAGREQSCVAIPDMEAVEAAVDRDLSDAEVTACTSCTMCANYISGWALHNELGWTSGICRPKGKLIIDTRVKQNARNCDYRVTGPRSNDLSGISLLPEYTDAFELATDPMEAFFEAQAAAASDPHLYPTDRPTTPEEEKAGIRAFRKIEDPEGTGNSIYLPIFDIEAFSPDDQMKIPRSGDDEHPELYLDHGGLVYTLGVLWTKLDETPAAWGEPGSGKTELYRHMAWLMCLPFERISITGSSELDDLAGKMIFENNETRFQMGRVPLAWGRKCVLVLDEPNTGPPDVWQFLRPLTDNSKQLVLDQAAGESVTRDDDCYLGLAMNPDWDPRNRGAEPIADADGSRLMHVWVPMPPEEVEKQIIRQRIKLDGWEIDAKRLGMLMRIAADIRQLSLDGSLPVTWGIRSQIKVARALRWWGPVTAYKRASADYLEPEAQAALLDVVKTHI